MVTTEPKLTWTTDAKPTRPDWLGLVISLASPILFLALLAFLNAKVPS